MKLIISIFMMFISDFIYAGTNTNFIVDFSKTSVQTIEVFRSKTNNLTFHLKNNDASVNASGYNAIFYSYKNTSVSNYLGSWITQTAGIFSVSIISNNLPLIGTYNFGVGISNSMGYTTATHGTFQVSK